VSRSARFERSSQIVSRRDLDQDTPRPGDACPSDDYGDANIWITASPENGHSQALGMWAARSTIAFAVEDLDRLMTELKRRSRAGGGAVHGINSGHSLDPADGRHKPHFNDIVG
jgi:hypothetical protein